MADDSSGGDDQERLLAERQEILRQLELLGPDSDSEDVECEAEDEEKMEEEGEKIEEIKEIKSEIVEEEAEESVNYSASKSPKTEEDFDSIDQDEERSLSSALVDEETQIGEEDEGGGEKEESSETTKKGANGQSFTPVEKIVMDRIDIDRNNPLPEGWVLIQHFSGMPVYYHKFTRVVTHSRPYQIDGMVRDHEVPISSIPCLYRQIMNKKHEELNSQQEKCPMSFDQKRVFLEIPPKERKLTPDQYREYAEKRFKFKKITVNRYHNLENKEHVVHQKKVNSLLKKRGFDMDYDQLKKNNNPGEVLLSSDSGAVLIDLTPAAVAANSKKFGSKKPYLLNPMGKTSVAVLNEFVQRLAKGTLVYDVEGTRNVSFPYKASAMLTMRMSLLQEMAGQCKESLIVLSEIAAASGEDAAGSANVPLDHKRFEIGSGVGANKKTARLVAAKDAILKLIPKLRITDEFICDGVLEEGQQKGYEEESRELFKKVKIDSPNLVQMCTRFAIPKPFSLLKDAINRSVRWYGMELSMSKEMVGSGSQLSKVTLKLGEMEGEAESVGVKQATQLAAQQLFKRMHVDLETYGAFLEIYGKLNDKAKLDNARRHHDQVVRLQDTGNLLEPNLNVLAKLAEEMKSVSLVYPPKKFQFGLAQNAMGYNTERRSVTTQTTMDPPPPPFPMMPPPPPHPYYSSPIPPPLMSQYPPPRQDYQLPQFYPNNPRKRTGRMEDGPPPPPPPQPQYNNNNNSFNLHTR